jgi:hypothetical protein
MLPGSRSPSARDAMTKSQGAGADRRHQRTDSGRIVGAIAVHEDDDVGGASSLSAFQASEPIAAPDTDDLGACATCFVRRAVALPPSATIMRSTISRGISSMTEAIDSASLKVGMTTVTHSLPCCGNRAWRKVVRH